MKKAKRGNGCKDKKAKVGWKKSGKRKDGYKVTGSLGRILNIRLLFVRVSLRKEILLLRVSHWSEI